MRTSTTLGLLLVAFASQAQSPYRPFPESDAWWREFHFGMDGGAGKVFDLCLRTIQFTNDTSIEGTTYHQLRSHGDCSLWALSTLLNEYTEPDEVFVAFRQDTTERKVYAYDVQANQEVLWYDFSLGLGDYPSTYGQPVSVPNIQVVALDSMLFNDGYHRTWVLAKEANGVTYNAGFCTVIEGIGASTGLNPDHILTVFPFDPYWTDTLNCYSLTGNVIHPLGATTCFPLATSIPPVLDQPALRAYPNPATNLIRFTTDLPAGARYTAFDTTGALVASGTVQHAQLDCSEWPVGLYAITLSDATGGVVGALRVVKE